MSVYTQAQVTEGLVALVAWAGNYTATSHALKAEGRLSVSGAVLSEWARYTHAPEYAELRDKYADQMEAQLIAEYRDVARQAVEVERAALDKALILVQNGTDRDPARTASHAARVAQTMTDKMLSLSGRPTSIREDRNVEQILRSLVGRGVLALPEAEVEVVDDADA